jgi:hypothetical protein
MAECEPAELVGATADGLMVQRYSGRLRRAGGQRGQWEGYLQEAADLRDGEQVPEEASAGGWPTLGKLSRTLDTHGAFPLGRPAVATYESLLRFGRDVNIDSRSQSLGERRTVH